MGAMSAAGPARVDVWFFVISSWARAANVWMELFAAAILGLFGRFDRRFALAAHAIFEKTRFYSRITLVRAVRSVFALAQGVLGARSVLIRFCADARNVSKTALDACVYISEPPQSPTKPRGGKRLGAP